MGNNSIPGSVVTSEREVGTLDVDGEQYRVIELRWNGTTARSYEVERAADGFLLTMDGAFDERPDADDIRDLVAGLRAEGTLPDLITPVSAMLPRPGVPLVVNPGFDAVQWLHDGQPMTTQAGPDGVLWWDASTPVEQAEVPAHAVAPRTDEQQPRPIPPHPGAQPDTAAGMIRCPQCTTPGDHARRPGGEQWRDTGCAEWHAVAERLPGPGTPIALLRRTRRVLWLMHGELCFAPVQDSGMVDWSRTDTATSAQHALDQAENDEQTTATDALHAHQPAGALLRIAAELGDEATVDVDQERLSLWRHAARELCTQAGQQRRAATHGEAVYGAAPSLDRVLARLRKDSGQRGNSAWTRALAEVTDHLARHTRGDNYRVTLLVARDERQEVVVRATTPQQAIDRVLNSDLRYLVTNRPVPQDLCKVNSVACLTSVFGLRF